MEKVNVAPFSEVTQSGTSAVPQAKPPNTFYRRIGKTLFKVTVNTSKTETETARDKIVRMIQNQVSTNRKIYGIVESPQMSLPSERRVS